MTRNKIWVNKTSYLLLASLVLAFSGCREILTDFSYFNTKTQLTSLNSHIGPKLPTVKPVNTHLKAKPTKESQSISSPLPLTNPKELINATRVDILAKLGEVSLERREKQSLVLQFIDDDCVLEVFLYGPYNHERASDFHFRSITGQAVPSIACYNRIRKQ